MRRALAPLAALTVLAAFAAAAVVFAAHQAIWVDETTQLSGLALPFGEQLAWLTGRAHPLLGVPPDRMPPLSYWLGDLWVGLFGLSETSMRGFGIVAMLAGAPALWAAARRLVGSVGAVFALGPVFLSSGMIVEAGEIRAYPLFFAFSAWALLAFVAVLQDRTGRRAAPLASLALLLLAATYTHFFGVVMAGLFGLSLFALVLIERRPVLPSLLAALGYCAAATGVLPFVAGALQVSGRATVPKPAISPKEVLVDTAKLGFHTLAGSSAFIYPALALILLAAAAGLLIIALRSAWAYSQSGRRSLVPYLVLPALLAFLLLPLLRMKIGSFDVLAPHYNIWLVPLTALILSAAFAAPSWIAWGLGGLFLAASLASDVILLAHPANFSHGPGEWLAAEIAAPERTLVVHDGTGAWGAAYFPLYYLTHGQVTQALLTPDGHEQLIRPGGLAPMPDWPANRFDRILYVKTTTTSTAKLAAALRHGCRPPPPRVLSAPFPAKTSSAVYCAFESAAMVIVTRQ